MRATARIASALRTVRIVPSRAVGPLLLLCAALATCCAPAKSYRTSRDFDPPHGGSRVLLMPPDIEIAELTAAGLTEPNAAWTQGARAQVRNALNGFFAERAMIPIAYRPRESGEGYDAAHMQTVLLHEAVGAAILTQKYGGLYALPTKKHVFDWSLGEAAAPLRADYDAEYALFPYFRESFASGGRVALIVVDALFGAGIPGGRQVGFASLVDLRSGNIVWFNTLVRGEGDVRSPEGAREAVEQLLGDLPL